MSNPASQLRGAAKTSPRASFGLCTSGKAFYPPLPMKKTVNARLISLRLGQFSSEGSVRVTGSLCWDQTTECGFDLRITGDKLIRFFSMIGWDDSRNSEDFKCLNQEREPLNKSVQVKIQDGAFYDIGGKGLWLLHPESD